MKNTINQIKILITKLSGHENTDNIKWLIEIINELTTYMIEFDNQLNTAFLEISENTFTKLNYTKNYYTLCHLKYLMLRDVTEQITNNHDIKESLKTQYTELTNIIENMLVTRENIRYSKNRYHIDVVPLEEIYRRFLEEKNKENTFITKYIKMPLLPIYFKKHVNYHIDINSIYAGNSKILSDIVNVLVNGQCIAKITTEINKWEIDGTFGVNCGRDIWVKYELIESIHSLQELVQLEKRFKKYFEKYFSYELIQYTSDIILNEEHIVCEDNDL